MRFELPSVIADIGKRYEQNLIVKAKKSLGQNFLINQNITEQIAQHIGLIEDEVVLEVGPGLGMLTGSIASICRPHKLILVEKDGNFIDLLRCIKKEYSEQGIDIFVIHDDAVQINEQELFQESSCRVIANLPYNISTVLLFKWLEKIDIFTSVTIMVQLEVAKRIVASPKSKSYGWISIISQTLCQCEIIMQIPPENFWPAPKVVSAVVHMVPKTDITTHDSSKLKILVKKAFLHRRKILRNTIDELVSWDAAAKFNILSSMRPEELSVEQWCMLSLL